MSQYTAPNLAVEAANGTRYAYRRLGKAGTVPVVFLQHFRGNLDNWDPALIHDIAAEREVILFDASGVALSSGAVPTSFHDFGRDALSFIDALALTKVDLFGFSIGGFVAQEVALQRPRLIRRLILAGTGPQGGREMHGWTEELRSHAMKDAQDAAIIQWGVSDFTKLSRLENIQAPTLVANGDTDVMVPTVNSYLLAGHLPDARLSIYPDAGHGFLFQYPHEFAAEVNAFLSE
jgi:pimeloyl-ACP methyl ester carboxylesterase